MVLQVDGHQPQSIYHTSRKKGRNNAAVSWNGRMVCAHRGGVVGVGRWWWCVNRGRTIKPSGNARNPSRRGCVVQTRGAPAAVIRQTRARNRTPVLFVPLGMCAHALVVWRVCGVVVVCVRRGGKQLMFQSACSTCGVRVEAPRP